MKNRRDPMKPLTLEEIDRLLGLSVSPAGSIGLPDVPVVLEVTKRPVLEVTERWAHKRSRFRPAHETFDPSLYGVEVIPPERDAIAKSFVETHHYAHSAPPTVFRAGLFEKTGPAARTMLVGVALFTVPTNEATIPSYVEGLSPRQGTELGRFVLLDHVKAMAETWFLARAFKALSLEKTELGLVVSFSDPVPKIALDGTVVMPGHIGLIYQAHNARYIRRTRPESFWQDRTGRDLAPRTLSKIRNEEIGWEAGMQGLILRGAPGRRPGEAPAAWLARALAEGPFQRIRHPGKFAYAWGLGRRRKEIEARLPEAQPYPRRG